MSPVVLRSSFKMRFIFLLLLTTISGQAPVLAQSAGGDLDQQPDYPGLDIQAVIGWDGRVEQEAPVPISFLISNQSSDVLEGHLIIADPESGREINLGDVFIGPGSVRRFSTVQALSGWSDCMASYTDGSTVFWKRQLPLMTGKDFSGQVNYLLFVDDGGRALQIPAEEPPQAASDGDSGSTVAESNGEEYVPRPGTGRNVVPVTVKTWQVPQHPGPLTVAQGLLFAESLKLETLNDQQWEAIGRWVCLGGTVFVHESSKEILDRLKSVSPLPAQPAVPIDEHQAFGCGAGSIRVYSGSLFSADDPLPIRTMLNAASKLSRYNILSVPDELPKAYTGASNANFTRLMVLALYSIYLLFSGVFTLLMFRSNRRRVVIYSVSVVTVTCLSAAVLGSYLRNSRGDLSWQSVVLGTGSGVVQVAKIEVQSAGGRNTRVAVRGKNADLQLLQKNELDFRRNFSRFRVYGGQHRSQPVGFFPFSVQDDLLKDDSDAFQINVPITPWGIRQNVATAFEPELKGVKVELQFLPQGSAGASGLYLGNGGSFVFPGQWIVSTTNSLPFDLTDCRLVLTAAVPQIPSNSNSPGLGPVTNAIQFSNGRGEIVMPELAAQATAKTEILGMPMIVERQDDWYSSPRVIAHEAAFPGAADIWFMGRISKSPLLEVDDANSDFEQFGENHYYMQKMTPDELPPEWVSSWRQFFESQLNAVQEQIRNSAKNQTQGSP